MCILREWVCICIVHFRIVITQSISISSHYSLLLCIMLSSCTCICNIPQQGNNFVYAILCSINFCDEIYAWKIGMSTLLNMQTRVVCIKKWKFLSYIFTIPITVFYHTSIQNQYSKSDEIFQIVKIHIFYEFFEKKMAEIILTMQHSIAIQNAICKIVSFCAWTF